MGLVKATRLRITSLKFISAVDAGAQGPIANVALVKRAPSGDQYRLTANVVKLDAAIGVVFGYAIASTVDGGTSPHVDLQGDAVLGGDELIKVALGFAEAGGQSDVMHDCVKDGWVPFVMPLNAETKKAFKLSGDVEGIAIGMKPSAETFKRFQTGELGAFSIYGEGVRTPLDEQQKRAPLTKRHRFDRVVKEAAMTDEVAGHVHVLDLDDPANWYQPWYSTSYQTAEDADNGHSHPWTFDVTTGAITIGADSGHSHASSQVVPPDVIAAFTALDAARDAENAAVAAAPMDAVCEPIAAEESSGKVSVVVVQARASTTTNRTAAKAAAAKSTPITPKPQGDVMKLVVLTEAQHAHFSKLSTDDGEAFIAKSSAERDAVLEQIAKSDPVVFKGELTGFEVRKSQGDFALKLAQSAEASAKDAKTAREATEVEKSAREATELRKRAEPLFKGLAGSDKNHDAILKAVESCDAETQTAFKAQCDLARKQAGSNAVAKGFGGTDPNDVVPQVDPLRKSVEKFQADNKIATYEQAFSRAIEHDAESRKHYLAGRI